MDLKLKGTVALVQGASRGIGRGIAEALAAEGCDLVITARTPDTLTQTAEEIAAAHGVRVEAILADSASLPDMDRLAASVERDFGRLDALVCNSGGPAPGNFADLQPDHWRAAAELLIVGPTYLLAKCLPLMRRGRLPRFFIVTSSSTRQPVPGLTLSNVYRPGIVGLIKTLSAELAPDGITCHSIAPGRFDTERLGKLIELNATRNHQSIAEARQEMTKAIPAQRLGDPAEIGHLVAFLASERADYLTGQNWLVDGGLIRAL